MRLVVRSWRQKKILNEEPGYIGIAGIEIGLQLHLQLHIFTNFTNSIPFHDDNAESPSNFVVYDDDGVDFGYQHHDGGVHWYDDADGWSSSSSGSGSASRSR